MAYRNSLLSLYTPPPTTSTIPPKTDLTSQFEEELPATAPVFEGHLYLRTEKKQWQWRLFRFDGTSFTCLSTRKVKLPPNTHVDAPLNDQLLLQSLPSFTSTSLTSPLLATPKNNTHQKFNTSTTSPLASYYQLPKWTVDIVNISAVSVLKPSSSNKKKLPVISQKQSRCFCVRTFDGNCYIMKAHKQKDLERWLFVLTKMWKFALAMKLQLASQQPQHQQILRQQQQQQQPQQHQSYLSSTSLLSTQSHQQIMSQQLLQSQDSIPLKRMYQRPQHTSLEQNNIADHSLSMAKPQHQMNVGLSSHPLTIPATTTHHHHTTKHHSYDYEKRYQHPMLSVEKSECIDAWRQSLSELMASDPQLQVSVPPPIESIPDDDKVSIISDMTSISHRRPTVRRRASIASTSSKRSTRSNKMKPRANAATPRLKKKRSNDVKNWIEPRKADNHNTLGPLMSTAPAPFIPMASSTTPANTTTTTTPQPPAAPAGTYHVGYFQDCKTTTGSTSMTSLDLNGGDDDLHDDHDNDEKNRMHHGNYQNSKTTTEERFAKYHQSSRIKQIHVVNPSLQQVSDNTATSSQLHQQHHSPPIDSSLPVHRSQNENGNNSTKNISPSSLMTPSPLYSLAHIDTHQTQQDDEEEISLADLQRSLKRTSLQQTSGIATSSSSSLTVSTPQRQSPYNSHHHTPPSYHSYQHYIPTSTSGMSITAPAIPPIPCSNNNMNPSSILSRPFTQAHRNVSNDFYQQPNRKWKKQTDQQQQRQHRQQDQRRNSWGSSCEQQKMIPLRQSMQLDTVVNKI